MEIAVVQTNPVFGDVAANRAEAAALIEPIRADVFVLPELFSTGYNFSDAGEVRSLAEPADGPTCAALIALARNKGCAIAFGFAERESRTGAIYNAAALVGPDGLIGVYRKVHLFYRENLFFSPGDLGFPVFPTRWGKLGMMICFDWYYPESARSLALGGAEVVLHPANLVLPHCPEAMKTRCLENRLYAATADRVGVEDRGGERLAFIGMSEIVSPKGEILARLGREEAGVAVAEIEPVTASDKRINAYNDLLGGRRIGQYRLE